MPSIRKALLAGAGLVAAVVLLRLLMVDADVTTLTLGIAFAVTALSLTVLTGYAGQLNLAVCSFGAIATLIAYHVGVTGTGQAARLTVWGVLMAVAVTAVIGAIVALPALRMRGLYLALATMAFGVFVTDMILSDIVPHRLPLLHTSFSLFRQGSLAVPPLKIGPLDLRDDTTFLISITVLFALLGIGMVALRNSSYGRRLAALKDSPVATAMLGQSVVRLKLGVFMLSAAIAGLGGVLMSSAIGAVTQDNFSIFVSLTVLLLAVSAGIGYVTGALMGGLMAGVGFAVVISSFSNLASGGTSLHSVYATLAHIAALLPALIGVTIGRSPSGFLHDLFAGYRTLQARARPVLIGGGVFEALIYVLALTGVIGNWWFGTLTYLGIILLPSLGPMFMPAAFRDAPPPPPLELIGIDVPYTPEIATDLNLRLGLPVSVQASQKPSPPPVPAPSAQLPERVQAR